MSQATSFYFPLRTVSAANVREHWSKRAKRARNERLAAYGFMRAHVNGERWSSATVRLIRVAPRRLDDDNLRPALKAVRDGIADALGVRDNDSRVRWEYEQTRERPKQYGVYVVVVFR